MGRLETDLPCLRVPLGDRLPTRGFLRLKGDRLAQYPMFPMWVQDYLADTSHLNATEHGVYHLLLYRYWLTDCKPLPEDLNFLLRVTKCRSKRVVSHILEQFWELSTDLSTGNGWRHKRVESEFCAAQERSSVARKSAEKRWKINDDSNANAMRTQCSPSPTQKKEKDSTYVESKKKKSRRFVKPTLEQVRTYCQERGNNVDPAAWMDHYEAKGWVVGKAPMKDWKAAVRTWERMNGSNGNGRQWETAIERTERKQREWLEQRKAAEVLGRDDRDLRAEVGEGVGADAAGRVGTRTFEHEP